MPKPASAWDPSDYLALQDIALWESTLTRGVEYQPSLEEKAIVQTRRGTSVDHLVVEDHGGDTSECLRAMIRFGIRYVIPSEGQPELLEEVEPDSPERTLIFELDATFAVEYKILKQPPVDVLEDFFAFNCTHNAWPFWRQHVYETLKKASLPVLAIPFFPGRPTATPAPEATQSANA